MDKYIVTIDGPTSAGTSSTGERVVIGFNDYLKRHRKGAKWNFVSAGSLYRAVTVYGLNNGVSPDEMNKEIESYKLGMKVGSQRILINGIEIPAEELSAPTTNANVAKYSPKKGIREFLEGQLGALIRKSDFHFITEGRNMYKLFPEAALKVYMTASLDVRARRKFEVFRKAGKAKTLDDVKAIVAQKDKDDYEREIDPMVRPEDAGKFYDYVIDNSYKTLEAAVAEVSAEIGKVVMARTF